MFYKLITQSEVELVTFALLAPRTKIIDQLCYKINNIVIYNTKFFNVYLKLMITSKSKYF